MDQGNHSHRKAQEQAARVPHINLGRRVVEEQKSHNRAQDTGRHRHGSKVPGKGKDYDVEHSPDRGNSTSKAVHAVHQV